MSAGTADTGTADERRTTKTAARSFDPTQRCDEMTRTIPGVLRATARVALATLVAAALPVFAQDVPKLKSGLWEMTHAGDQGAAGANRITLCMDQSLQQQMFEMGVGAMKGMCSRHEFHLSGKRGSGDFVCEMGGSRMHSTSKMVIDGNSAYRTEIHTTWDPPVMGLAQTNTVVTAHWVSPCLSGQRPGDMTTAQGHKFNIRDAMQGARGAAH